MENLTAIIPFFNGHRFIGRLLESLPADLPVIIIDDMSSTPLDTSSLPETVKVHRMPGKGYFTGAVNTGVSLCDTDVLVLNQDVWLDGDAWQTLIATHRDRYALIGEGVSGTHPAWPAGYIHGTFMYARRDAITAVGPMDAVNYPLWGSTCLWQLQMARAGYQVLPVRPVPGLHHARGDRPYGEAIQQVLKTGDKDLLIRTPPMVSVVISNHNYGRYLPAAVASLIGGETDLGYMPGQTFQSFEIVIVDDASDETDRQIARTLADPWKGIRVLELSPVLHDGRPTSSGTPVANNVGIRSAFGRYIAILCADDMMQPDRLERMVGMIQDHPHAFVYDNPQVMRGGTLERVMELPAFDFDRLIHKNHVHAGILFPKQAWQEVGGYPVQMRYGREDWAFNVALGRAGYCGVKVPGDYAGYLYRREGQNRTELNTTDKWQAFFNQQLRGLFPELYRGERPMGCCGGNKTVANTRSATPPNTLTGADGMTVLEYTGLNDGKQTFYAPSGARYVSGRTKPYVLVDNRDVEWMLDLFDGTQLFKVADQQKPAVVTEPVVTQVGPAVTSAETAEIGAQASVPGDEVVLSLPDPGSYTVSEFTDLLAAADYGPEELATMADTERAGKNRKGILDLLTYA